ncbi:MAG TPA: tetratricopeptide repeat protein [Gemmataceae bacterium]
MTFGSSGGAHATPLADTAPVAGLNTTAGGRSRADYRRAAELVADAADALEHAHALGIVHRDVKPANLLVDAAGKVWVADFGLARSGPDAGLTMTGDLLGTLRYMAPEQALARHGLVDHRADVYGLGATLYELLTLRPAVGGEDKREILRTLAFEDPPPPHRLDGGVPAELETIALKALAKEPADRYATAGELADDLRRFLDDRPIAARPPTVRQRLARWARRRRQAVVAAVVAVVVVLALAVAGLAVNTVLIDRERAAADQARRQADANFRKALAAVDQLLTRVGQERLADVPQMEQVRRELLQDALTFYQAFLAERGDDPAVRREAGRAHGRLANIYYALGQYAQAEDATRQAIALLDALAADGALEPDARADLAEAHRIHGAVLRALRRDGVAAACRRSVAHLEELTAAFPDVPDYRRRLAISCTHLGSAMLPGRPREVEALFRRAVALTAGDAGGSLELVVASVNLAGLLLNTGRPREAEAVYRQALDTLEKLPDDVARRADYRSVLGQVVRCLAYVFRKTERAGEAEAAYRRALAQFETLAAEFPAVLQHREALATTHSDLGDLLRAAGRPREAEAAFREALRLDQELADQYRAIPRYRQALLRNQYYLGQALVGAGRAPESLAAFGQALALQEQVLADFPGELADLQRLAACRIDLGHVLAQAGRAAEADAEYRQALALRAKAEAEFADRPEYRYDLAAGHVDLARRLLRTGRVSDQERLYRWALGHYLKLVADPADGAKYCPGLAGVKLSLGALAQHTGRLPEAESAYREALDLYARLAEGEPDVAAYREGRARLENNLGSLLQDARRPREAEPAFRRAMALWEALAAEFPTERLYPHWNANARNNLGYLLTETGRAAEAEPLHRRALALFQKLAAEVPGSPSYDDGQGMSYAGLSAVLAAGGRLSEAEGACRHAVALYENLATTRPNPWYQFKLAEEQHHLASLLAAVGRNAEAERAFRQSRDGQEGLAAQFPTVVQYRRAAAAAAAGLARLLTATGRFREAESAYRQMADADPKNAGVHNDLAWLLATCPEPAVRDPGRAVALAGRAVELAPAAGAYWNTLGVARYRAGDWAGAVAALEKSAELRHGGDAFDWLFLAMAHHQLGDADQARRRYEQAVAWAAKNRALLDKNKPLGDELRRFQAEAESRLGRAGPPPPG